MSYPIRSLFCPITLACQVLQPRWTIQILAEIGWGSHRFNEIKQHIPGISPSLLSKRLKEMETNQLIHRRLSSCGRVTYHRTASGKAIEPAIRDLGIWAYQHLETGNLGEQADLMSFLMNLRRSMDLTKMPDREVIIELQLSDKPKPHSIFWLYCIPGQEIELCVINPQLETDLCITCAFPDLVAFYFGECGLDSLMNEGLISVIGDHELKTTLSQWLLGSSYAQNPDIAKYQPHRSLSD